MNKSCYFTKRFGKEVHGEFTEPWFAFTKLNGTLVQHILDAVLEMEK
jgi:hypothetical protein